MESIDLNFHFGQIFQPPFLLNEFFYIQINTIRRMETNDKSGIKNLFDSVVRIIKRITVILTSRTDMKEKNRYYSIFVVYINNITNIKKRILF